MGVAYFIPEEFDLQINQKAQVMIGGTWTDIETWDYNISELRKFIKSKKIRIAYVCVDDFEDLGFSVRGSTSTTMNGDNASIQYMPSSRTMVVCNKKGDVLFRGYAKTKIQVKYILDNVI